MDRVEAERTQADDGNCKGWSLVGAGGGERAVLVVNRALSRVVHASPEHPCPLSQYFPKAYLDRHSIISILCAIPTSSTSLDAMRLK